MEQRRIICLQHCSKKVNIFAFDVVPERCPVCAKCLEDEVLHTPPFLLPYPFRSSNECPCSLVIKPSRGSFLRDYANSTDLHIGVTDSAGKTYEYDSSGLRVTRGESWTECLPIFINADRRGPTSTVARPLCPLWKERWDAAIVAVATESHWTKDRYNTENHNCFSFVLEFLRCVGVDAWTSCLRDKTSLCSAFILPVTTLAGKYISLYRQLLRQNCVMLVSC
ncbi:unnamed protein product [Notodromas monacha]|uniref:MKRN2 opposite strand protein n=1 Tax=Notodromas monacha TaxID=399045 RepID=A0A7R9BHW2_9CRUS|nr:unnamed protein product [Notodromas monacha]CAG0915801.1 unnamed protein product [Notodromas monacha]